MKRQTVMHAILRQEVLIFAIRLERHVRAFNYSSEAIDNTPKMVQHISGHNF